MSPLHVVRGEARMTTRLEVVPWEPEVEAVPALAVVPAADPEPGRSHPGRALALGLLVATVLGVTWLGVEIYYVASDAWIAPLHLSPDSDRVAQLRVQHERTLAELARLDAEVARLDGERVAIESAVAKLSNLRGAERATLAWQAEQGRVEIGGLHATVALLTRQRALVDELLRRQTLIAARARTDLAAGLVDRTAVEREAQVEDQLRVDQTDLDRQLAEASTRLAQAETAQRGFRASAGGRARMPEVAAGDEHAVRIEVEIERLLAEARGHVALRDVAASSAASQRALLAQLESTPLYRAMTTATDIAFVPYDQLPGVQPGARVMACLWSAFQCRTVGHVTEVVPGEVVTQDPWGSLARGQYAVLALDDADAVRERVLRVRR